MSRTSSARDFEFHFLLSHRRRTWTDSVVGRCSSRCSALTVDHQRPPEASSASDCSPAGGQRTPTHPVLVLSSAEPVQTQGVSVPVSRFRKLPGTSPDSLCVLSGPRTSCLTALSLMGESVSVSSWRYLTNKRTTCSKP